MFRRVLYSILSILVCLSLAAACTGPEQEPVKPDVPEQPENPDKPDQPDQPQEPDNPDNPVDPDNPDTPEEPEALLSGELPEGDFTLTEGTIYLPDSFVETVSEHDKAFGFFKTTSKALPKEGDVLVYNKFTEQFPEGFLGKVSRVEDGYVYYDPVPLEEAFTHLQIDTTSLNLADNVAYVVDGEGKPVSFTKTRAMATSGIGIAIPSNVTWDLYSSGYNYEGLEANVKMTLTPSMNVYLGMRFQAVIDNGEGTPCDSARCLPTSSSSSQKLKCSLPTPQGASMARLRFYSRDADMNNCGFVKRIELTPVNSSPGGGDDEPIVGDVDGNSRVDIADVSALIDLLLGGSDTSTPQSADVDRDGSISIADVSALIDMLLSGNN